MGDSPPRHEYEPEHAEQRKIKKVEIRRLEITSSNEMENDYFKQRSVE